MLPIFFVNDKSLRDYSFSTYVKFPEKRKCLTFRLIIRKEAVYMLIIRAFMIALAVLPPRESTPPVQIRSFFWSVFSHIWTEYGEILRISLYSVRMRENTDQKKLRIWILFPQFSSRLMFGRELRIPIDIMFSSSRNNALSIAIHEYEDQLKNIYNIARNNIQTRQCKSVRYQDRKMKDNSEYEGFSFHFVYSKYKAETNLELGRSS